LGAVLKLALNQCLIKI
jgi:hypothetical protein